MNREFKIDFISTIISSDLSGASLNNKKIAEKVKNKIISENINLQVANDNTINLLIIMLGYSQILES
jgi:hypothetical protein